MQILHMVCQKLKLDTPTHDQEVSELSQDTEVTALVDEIEKAREDDPLQ